MNLKNENVYEKFKEIIDLYINIYDGYKFYRFRS